MSVHKALFILALAAFVLYDIAVAVFMAYITLCRKAAPGQQRDVAWLKNVIGARTFRVIQASLLIQAVLLAIYQVV